MLEQYSIRTLKKLASAEKLPKYSSNTKAQLIERLSYLEQDLSCEIATSPEVELPQEYPQWIMAIAILLVVLQLTFKSIAGLANPLAQLATWYAGIAYQNLLYHWKEFLRRNIAYYKA